MASRQKLPGPWQLAVSSTQKHRPSTHGAPGLHVVQAPPPEPQKADVLPSWQNSPAQQPAQVLGSHTQVPLTHAVPKVQRWQLPPPVPQAWGSPTWHTPCRQQPFGQVVESQGGGGVVWHVPLRHETPAVPHSVQLPPPVPQAWGSFV